MHATAKFEKVTKADLAEACELLEYWLTRSDELVEGPDSVKRVVAWLDATISDMRSQNAGA